MDNLTHSLVGLFLARAGCKYATPRGTAIMVLAANAPDSDVVCTLGGAASYIHWHRHITHSLIAVPVMALLTVAVVRWVGRRPVRWLPAFLIAMLGVASHLILDLTNLYGVRLLLPFSDHWFHWDITPVVDLVIWLILLLGVVAPWFGKLVGSEIGERRRNGGGGWAVAALLLLGAYDYGRSVLHDRAVETLESRVYHGRAPRRVAAFPEANPLVWNGLAELSDSYVMVPVDLRTEFRPENAETYNKPERTPAMLAAMETRPFRNFLGFVLYPIWAIEPVPDQPHITRVRLVDLRFGTPPEPGFEAVATVTDQNRVTDSLFTFGTPQPR
ncbi:MAG TPA: metal-dependent hydrolase [Bryobacteraceae bacterium]|nr:metal-dependent hydrolase [Bryobacteraceae bacterium]